MSICRGLGQTLDFYFLLIISITDNTWHIYKYLILCSLFSNVIKQLRIEPKKTKNVLETLFSPNDVTFIINPWLSLLL